MARAAREPDPRLVRHLGVVGSTMAEAADWAAAGAPHGAVVTAEGQRVGRGRHGRRWEDEPGDSLLMTVVLRPELPVERLGLIPLAAGLAVAEGLDPFGVQASVKWPNDVRVGGRKLAGVLAESRAGGRLVLLGVGVNVAQAAFPKALAETATSLRQATGRVIDRLAPLAPILDQLDRRLADATARPARLVAAVEARLDTLGREVTVRDPSTGNVLAQGTALGLAPSGALRLATAAGERAVSAGEVTLGARGQGAESVSHGNCGDACEG